MPNYEMQSLNLLTSTTSVSDFNHVSLKNGTDPTSKEVDPIEAIGVLQLLPEMSLRDNLRIYKELEPMDVMKFVAKKTGTIEDLKSATVILVVDRLQFFTKDPNDGLNEDSAFYHALAEIGDLAFQKVFLMECCTATITNTVNKALTSSHQKRVLLPPRNLDRFTTRSTSLRV